MVSMIQELSETKKEHSLQTLAETFGVSQRTVRNDLNSINELLDQHGLQLLRLDKGGKILRESDFEQIHEWLDDKNFYEYKLSREERKEIASVLLICSSGYVTLADLAEHMVVSRATVIHDLDDIKQYLREGKLEVRSHPNKGLQIEGKESDKRQFLLKIASRNPEEQREDIVKRQLQVGEDTSDILRKILREQEHVHGCYLSDPSFQKMVTYLGILSDRILRGEYIEPGQRSRNTKYLMARDILNYVEQYCHIRPTEEEIQYLSELLASCWYMKQKRQDKDAVRIQMITRQFIEKLSEDLGINLNQDYHFFESLVSHLESTLQTSVTDFAKNTVIEHVIKENEDVMAAVEKNLFVLQQYAGRLLTRTEVEYIAVHVCAAIERKKNQEISFHVIVACHAGIGTSHLLLEKLKKHFNFQIVDIVSSHETSNLQQGQADFVISTVPLKECALEHITVSPLLRDEDYIRIGNMVDRLRNDRNFPPRREIKRQTGKELMDRIAPILYREVPEKAESLEKQIRAVVHAYLKEEDPSREEQKAPWLYQLLDTQMIQLDVKCTDWKDAVRKSALPLLQMQFIEERYIDAMIRNIEENGPYIVLSKGFALPHEGTDQGVKKVCMNLIRLKEPVAFGAEERDPVEFVCTLGAVDHESHLQAFFHLVNLLKKETFKEDLRRAKTSEEAAECIRRYESMLEEGT